MREKWVTGTQHPSGGALMKEEEENEAQVPALATGPLCMEAVFELPLGEREENSLTLVVLAELEIPFKDKLVTEKIQQQRHASTLLSVAHDTGGDPGIIRVGSSAESQENLRAGLDPLRHRAASCSSGQEAMWEMAFPAELFISLLSDPERGC